MRTIILLTAALLAITASAIEPPKQQTPPATAPATPQAENQPAAPPPPAADRPDIADDPAEVAAKEATAKAEAEAKAADEEVLPPLPAGAATSGPPAARFTPTEKVRADFPVSFPIDI